MLQIDDRIGRIRNAACYWLTTATLSSLACALPAIAQPGADLRASASITASSERSPAEMAGKVLDGAGTATGWHSAPGDNRPTLQIDMKTAQTVGRIDLFLGSAVADNPLSRANFEVILSNRSDFEDGVVVCMQGGTALALGALLQCDWPVEGRYRYVTVRKLVEMQPLAINDLRIQSTASIKGPFVVGTRKPVYVSSQDEDKTEAEFANDGNPDTAWMPSASDARPTLTIDLMEAYPLDAVRVSVGSGAKGLQVMVADDLAFTRPVKAAPAAGKDGWLSFAPPQGAAYRYVRVVADGMVAIKEVEIASSRPDARPLRTAWMPKARYGVFLHYLKDRADLKGDWNKTVAAFDVKRFATQMREAGVGYVVITMGQNSGYYIAPNATYDRITGYAPGERNALRDLPMDLSAALEKEGIRLMLYSSGGAPLRDPKATAALDWKDNQSASQTFQAHWEAILAEWSARYGDKVSGWWIDGMYCRACYSDMSRPHNYNTLARALQTGNPDAVVAFNTAGIVTWGPETPTHAEDYTSGEITVMNRSKPAIRLRPMPMPPFVKQSRWHVLSYLGSYWGDDDVKYRDDYLADYVARANAGGGAVTFDIAIYRDGSIAPGQFEQLKALKAKLDR
ncbi:discoidin domain-containing protein [Sphingobium algorifonticola]|uniref:Discoidin domain-containing protein n=1 Tax=Sphingobium algorifonticola TaxID=2008318 RepID=A0A437J430_9SPHN|nr:discoidin domain-containing protein [Sphingobium algorifonticola]RVT39426.1 discoidin domain-containing protein [Sphingobium algorifonticola]